jgi:DmsE family decaheme c-type cytochrome
MLTRSRSLGNRFTPHLRRALSAFRQHPARHLAVLGILVIAALAWGAYGDALGAKPSTASPPAAQEYAGSDACMTCHADQAKLMDKTVMGKIMLHFPRTDLEKRGCEACHGPRSRHVDDPANPAYQQRLFGKYAAKASPEKQNAVCIGCHDKGEHLYWQGSVHQRRQLACVRCHTAHQDISPTHQLAKPDEFQLCGQCHQVRRAQLQRTSHMPMRESKMTCSDCHNPHGSVTAKLLRGNTANDLCYRCHAEKRGPFLWEHQPVKESCMNCHEPHGSINDHLLKRKAERLCQACHITNRHPTQPHDFNTRFVFNRSCRNCHPMIHGSNDPSGRFFLR